MQRKADKVWQCGKRFVRVDGPSVMGIVNVTPDSFFAGSRASGAEDAVARAVAMVRAGAAIIDIGGESTRPGAEAVCAEEELLRVAPVIRGVRAACPEVLISVDTRHTATARGALAAGADIVNDVAGLEPDAGMAALVAESECGYVLTHACGWTRASVADLTDAADIVAAVGEALRAAMARLVEAGVKPGQIALDPGLGFEKTHADSWRLLGATAHFAAWDPIWLVGASRKRFLGGDDAAARGPASVGAALWAVSQGADVVRVHDVPETVGAIRAFMRAREAAHV